MIPAKPPDGCGHPTKTVNSAARGPDRGPSAFLETSHVQDRDQDQGQPLYDQDQR
jgi:hypothetical protein